MKTVRIDSGDQWHDPPQGKSGILAISGPTVFPGYVVGHGADGPRMDTLGTVRDGWLNTGDLAHVDADGFIHLRGHAKDLIIRGGHNIDPAVIVSPLHHHRAGPDHGVPHPPGTGPDRARRHQEGTRRGQEELWIRIPRFDYTPSERLRRVLSGGQPHRANEWSHTPGRSLEDQLTEIAQEVTLRGEAAERRRLDEIEAARQKRIRWEAP
ncbi:hypothetical protein ACFU51_38130, partial [Streptomyces sp. NPDC057430]